MENHVLSHTILVSIVISPDNGNPTKEGRQQIENYYLKSFYIMYHVYVSSQLEQHNTGKIKKFNLNVTHT